MFDIYRAPFSPDLEPSISSFFNNILFNFIFSIYQDLYSQDYLFDNFIRLTSRLHILDIPTSIIRSFNKSITDKWSSLLSTPSVKSIIDNVNHNVHLAKLSHQEKLLKQHIDTTSSTTSPSHISIAGVSPTPDFPATFHKSDNHGSPDYKFKYLKYKNKYISLKRSL